MEKQRRMAVVTPREEGRVFVFGLIDGVDVIGDRMRCNETRT
jgi:hypothetical protein